MKRNNGVTIVIAFVSLVLLAIVGGSLPAVRSPSDSGSVDSSDPPLSSSDDLGGGDGERLDLLSFQSVFLVVLGLVALLALGIGYRTLTRPSSTNMTAATPSPSDETDSSDDPSEASLESIATVAGRAADRIHQTDAFENEIYRAWWEMTRCVSDSGSGFSSGSGSRSGTTSPTVSNTETTTPGEFATAAIRAGMDESDVHELTQLFDRVRYGGQEPTAEDEQHAIDVLTRIEASYRGESS